MLDPNVLEQAFAGYCFIILECQKVVQIAAKDSEQQELH